MCTQSPATPPTPAPKPGLKARAVSEFKKFLLIFLYLFVLLGLLVLHESIVLRQHGLKFTHYGFAFINAFVLGKVLLVGESLGVGHIWGRPGPLVYAIATKAVLFAIVLIAFHFVEEIITGMIKGETFTESLPTVGGGGVEGILCTGVIVAFALVPYFAFKEVDRVIGKGVIRELVLKGRAEGTTR